MAHISVHVLDGSDAVDDPAALVTTDYPEFEVVAEGGLFKNGRLFKRGERLKLAPETAARFIALGEIKE